MLFSVNSEKGKEKCVHRTPAGLRERQTCIGIIFVVLQYSSSLKRRWLQWMLHIRCVDFPWHWLYRSRILNPCSGWWPTLNSCYEQIRMKGQNSATEYADPDVGRLTSVAVSWVPRHSVRSCQPLRWTVAVGTPPSPHPRQKKKQFIFWFPHYSVGFWTRF
jgi:hypothetical protein